VRCDGTPTVLRRVSAVCSRQRPLSDSLATTEGVIRLTRNEVGEQFAHVGKTRTFDEALPPTPPEPIPPTST
jgi:hypothetical protein